jgi:hypothetical protein
VFGQGSVSGEGSRSCNTKTTESHLSNAPTCGDRYQVTQAEAQRSTLLPSRAKFVGNCCTLI